MNDESKLKEIAKALPAMLQLMNNPSFVKQANELGYEFDAKAILKAVTDMLVSTPPITIGMPRKPRLTAADFVMLREMGIKL